jgi:branched-chain amino acid transport system permease protein
LKYSHRKLIVLAVVLVVALALPFFIGNVYYLHIAIMASINSILGMGFALLYSVGLITLGMAAYYGIGAYASTLLVMKSGLSFWVAMPAAGIITGIVAAVIGLLIVRYPGVGFVVFTLVTGFVMQRIWGAVRLFGGWGGIIGIPPPNPIFGVVDFSSKIHYYYLSLFLLLVTVVVLYGLYQSRIGRAWRAIKLDPRLAATTGINAYVYRLAAFGVACGFAGLAGSFYAHYAGTIMPDAFDLHKSIYIQIYAILGGLESYILGPLTGAVVFTAVPEFLRMAPEIEPYFTGCLLIALVIFLPSGLAGVAQRVPGLLSQLYAACMQQLGASEHSR